MEYFLTDQLGSVILALDATGNPIAGTQQRYMPFGQPRFNNTPVTDFAYTGQRDLDMQGNSFSLGLMDYNARFYDAYLNRWSQPDSIISYEDGPQGLDRYSYVLNNPFRYTDPSGHQVLVGVAVDAGLILLVATVVVGFAYYTNPQVRQSIDQVGQYLADQTEAERQANAHQREIDYINSQSGQTADGGNIFPGGGGGMAKGCLNNLYGCISLIFAGAALVGTSVYCSADSENCSNNANQNKTKTVPTPMPTSANAPSGAYYCSPFTQCPNTPSSNSTKTPLPSPALTPIMPPDTRRLAIPE